MYSNLSKVHQYETPNLKLIIMKIFRSIIIFPLPILTTSFRIKFINSLIFQDILLCVFCTAIISRTSSMKLNNTRKGRKNKFQTYFKVGVVSSNVARYEYIINTCLCLLPELFCGGNASCFTIVTYHKHLTTINSDLYWFTKL